MPSLIGNKPNQVPTNGDLGTLAFEDKVNYNTNKTSNTIEVTDNTNAALRITQLGTGNALLVEDSTNPDSSPTVIDASGNVIIGNTTSVPVWGFGNSLQIWGGFGYVSQGRFTNDAFSSFATQVKSRSTTIGGQTIVQSGDELGRYVFAGSDGTNFIAGATISGQVDGTPGTNDMPGRLVFSTTADGASSATERMRIDNAGNVGIGATANASAILDAQSTTKGVRMPNMTTTQKNAIASPAAGLMVFDTTLAKLCVYSGATWQTITSV
jgi:hypothetical protein